MGDEDSTALWGDHAPASCLLEVEPVFILGTQSPGRPGLGFWLQGLFLEIWSRGVEAARALPSLNLKWSQDSLPRSSGADSRANMLGKQHTSRLHLLDPSSFTSMSSHQSFLVPQLSNSPRH